MKLKLKEISSELPRNRELDWLPTEPPVDDRPWRDSSFDLRQGLEVAELPVEHVSAAAVDPAASERSLTADLVRWRTWMLGCDLNLTLEQDDLERWCAWAFPSGGNSGSRDAPSVGRHAMRSAVAADPALRNALLQAWTRMLAHLGLVEQDDGTVVWIDAPRAWATAPGAMDRHVSRALRAMHNAALPQAGRLMDFLERAFGDERHATRVGWWRHQVLS